MKKVLALLLAAVLFIGAAPMLRQEANALSSSTGMYLNIYGIEGECSNPRYEKWIDVISFRQELSKESNYSSETTVTLTVSHYADKATEKIIKAYCSGQHFPTAQFDKTQYAAGKQEVLYSVKMTDVKITYSGISSDAESNLIETFTLTGTLVLN